MKSRQTRLLLSSRTGAFRLPALLAVCAHIAAVVTPELLPSVFFHLLGKRLRSHNNAERHLVLIVGFR